VGSGQGLPQVLLFKSAVGPTDYLSKTHKIESSSIRAFGTLKGKVEEKQDILTRRQRLKACLGLYSVSDFAEQETVSLVIRRLWP
jgi:hypothetical protein